MQQPKTSQDTYLIYQPSAESEAVVYSRLSGDTHLLTEEASMILKTSPKSATGKPAETAATEHDTHPANGVRLSDADGASIRAELHALHLLS